MPEKLFVTNKFFFSGLKENGKWGRGEGKRALTHNSQLTVSLYSSSDVIQVLSAPPRLKDHIRGFLKVLMPATPLEPQVRSS